VITHKKKFTAALLSVLIALVIGLLWPQSQAPQGTNQTGSDFLDMLRGDIRTMDQGFKRVISPRTFQFPDDHGPHPDYKTEWWYFTGNLKSTAGQHFGYQLTFFRESLTSEEIPRQSAWSTAHVYMAHFALTDIDNGEFYHFGRFSRASKLGLAGAQAKPFRVWLEDWSVQSSGTDFFPLRLTATTQNIAVSLLLNPAKSLILQGDKGLSQKSEQVGQASYYYSATRMASRGRIQRAGEVIEVRGLSWLDREWSSYALGDDLAGWDWFALQLSNGADLMYYQLRKKDGSTSAYSKGNLISEKGQSTPLVFEQIQLSILNTWQSPSTGIRYPIHWKIFSAQQRIDLEVKAVMLDQEMKLTPIYWEGAVEVKGRIKNEPVTGRGYLELSGYKP